MESLDLEELYDVVDSLEQDLEDDSPEVDSSTCSQCGDSDSLIRDVSAGLVSCRSCGAVVDDVLDQGEEWRNSELYGKTPVARCSGYINPHLPKSSLGTSIGGWGRSNVRRLSEWTAMPPSPMMLVNPRS